MIVFWDAIRFALRLIPIYIARGFNYIRHGHLALRLFVLSAIALLTFYVGFYNNVEQYQAGIAWNRFTGRLELQHAGMYLTPPWVSVSTIDTRPMRVCVTSAGRGFNCKLVRFVPEAYQEFVATEGHYYFWWANRFSFNTGYHDEYRGMKDLMRGYAYSTMGYKFVDVMTDTKS